MAKPKIRLGTVPRGLLLAILTLNLFNYTIAPPCRKGNKKVLPGPILHSKMCRCFNRPNENFSAPIDDPPKVDDVYTLEIIPFDEDEVENHLRSICVYFGHAGEATQGSHVTKEVIIEALNEHGWPFGSWEIAPFSDTCVPPTSLSRKNLYKQHFYDEHKCYRNDLLGFAQYLHTEGEYRPGTPPPERPTLFQFKNYIRGRKRGINLIFNFNTEPTPPKGRAKSVRFVAEAYYQNPAISSTAEIPIRVLSPTYNITYPVNPQEPISTAIIQPDILLNLDYANQVFKDECLKKPPPPPELPTYAENTCVCFLRARRQDFRNPEKPPGFPRLNLTGNVTEVHSTDAVGLDINLATYLNEKGKKIVNDNPNSESIMSVHPYPNEMEVTHLAVLYPFLPVYKERDWRQREVVINDLRGDTGTPMGRFLDPYSPTEGPLYKHICSDAILKHPNEVVNSTGWIKPPFPAVGNCTKIPGFPPPNSHKKYSHPCYFHFHSDWFFVDCVDECIEPKIVCAVWTYDPSTAPHHDPGQAFEFQFIATAVYYKNIDPPKDDYEEIQGQKTEASCPLAVEYYKGFRPWNLMETHLSNKAYSFRSDLWKYRGINIPKKRFKRVASPNEDTNSILIPDYFNLTQRNETKEEDCVLPATYYLETKDNNLCACTFWQDNLVTWQTHYGRKFGCKSSDTIPFDKIFSVRVHKVKELRKPNDIFVRAGAENKSVLLGLGFIIHSIVIEALDENGLPVGEFSPGHQTPLSVEENECRSDVYPTSEREKNVLKRHPVFESVNCANFPDIPALGVTEQEAGNLFIMKNQWEDDTYFHVCAKFNIRRNKHNPTRIQFLSFIRVVDLEENPFMVEVRSDWVNGQDLTEDINVLQEGEDKMNNNSILNYEYFRSTLTVQTHSGFERGHCLDPLKEPRKIFQLCRRYLVTPYYKEHERLDIDEIIDEYNEFCIQYTNALRVFQPTHPFVQALKDNLNISKRARDVVIDWKQCFEVVAYKHKLKNSFHVKFRYLGDEYLAGKHSHLPPSCWIFNNMWIKEAGIVALNERGYPIGLPYAGKDYKNTPRGSFVLFNHYRFKGDDRNPNKPGSEKWREFCTNDTIQLNLDDLVTEARMVTFGDRAKCYYGTIGKYTVNKVEFLQKWDSDADTPSLLLWANIEGNVNRNGFCAHWNYYKKPDVPPHETPKAVQFVVEVQFRIGTLKKFKTKRPEDEIDNTDEDKGNPQIGDSMIVIRSPKYKFEYQEWSEKDEDSWFDQDFLDRYGNDDEDHDCHAEEAEIIYDYKPNDTCHCDLHPILDETKISTTTPLPMDNITTVPPPSTTPKPDLPLCNKTYYKYNHRLHKNLYRSCLARDRGRSSEISRGDCKTKIDYPNPPEVYPNEMVFLSPDGPKFYLPNASLENIDPTFEAFEACGFIKHCVTRFRSAEISRQCIADQSCDMIVAFGKALAEMPDNDEAIIEIYAHARGWAAVGISPNDEVMGDDYVIECAKEGREVNIYNSWNYNRQRKEIWGDSYTGSTRRNVRMKGGNNSQNANIRVVKNVFFEDKLYCKFYIKKKFLKIDPALSETHEYDLDRKYHFIMAFSNELPDPYGEDTGAIKTHVPNGNFSEFGLEKVTAGLRYSPLPLKTKAFRIHGYFTVTCWVFCMTMSIFVARYYKETLVDTFYTKKLNFWMFWHVTGVFFGGCCLFLGELARIYAQAGWENTTKSNFHKITGYGSDIFFVLCIFTGICSKTSRRLGQRKHLINLVHVILGHTGYVFAILNLGFAARVPYGFLSCTYSAYIWVWVFIYFFIHLVMTYHYWWIDFVIGRKVSTRRYFAIDVMQTPHLLYQEEEDEDEDETEISPPPEVQSSPSDADTSTKESSSDIEKGKPRRSVRKSFRNRRSNRVSNAQFPTIERPPEVEYYYDEAPGTYVRIFILSVFTLFCLAYTAWIVRKLISYPRHCYDFDKLQEMEDNSFFNKLF